MSNIKSSDQGMEDNMLSVSVELTNSDRVKITSEMIGNIRSLIQKLKILIDVIKVDPKHEHLVPMLKDHYGCHESDVLTYLTCHRDSQINRIRKLVVYHHYFMHLKDK
jgi:hypothetical protein